LFYGRRGGRKKKNKAENELMNLMEFKKED
jgi:hypothetical protein